LAHEYSVALSQNGFMRAKSQPHPPRGGTSRKTTGRHQGLELRVTKIAISDLKPDPKNPRVHNERQVRQLAKSIDTFGFVQPVLIDGMRRVIAGHGRIEAAKLLGLHEVPTISLRHLSDTQLRALVIADNRLAEQAFWDEKLLGEHLKFLSEVELSFDLEAKGFEIGEIDVLIEGLAPDTADGMDPADVLPEPTSQVPVSRKGDLWLLDRHRLLSGNSLDKTSYETLMAGRNAAVVFADPPYNVPIAGHATGLGAIQHKNFQMASGELSESEFIDFLARAFSLMASHSSHGSLHFVCTDWRHLYEMSIAGKQVFSEVKNVCVWVKSNGGMGSLYRSQHEPIFVFKNGTEPHRNNVQLGQFGRYRINVWQYAGANSFSRSTEEGNVLEFHPTTKPAALVGDALMDCSRRGEIVLDPFVGGGTTIVAAERTGRICYGVELDPAYVDTSVRRWQRLTGKTNSS
jgi:DNA modification methylase